MLVVVQKGGRGETPALVLDAAMLAEIDDSPLMCLSQAYKETITCLYTICSSGAN
jgi:hypothetical protein